MEVRPGYKQTELGVIPDDWGIESLVDLVDPARSIRYGIVQPGKYDRNGRYMIRGQDYSEAKGWASPAEVFRVSAGVEKRYRNARVRANDLIMTIVGYCGHVEQVPAWLDGANLTQTTARIAVDETRADSRFCKYMLQSSAGAKQVAGFLKGAAQPGLNCGDVEKFLLPLPASRAEQSAIATALSDVDVLLGALDRLIAKKRDLKQAAMQQLLTGKTRLPGFHGEWEVSPLKRFVRNFIVPMRDKPKRLTGDIPWCRIEDFDGMYLADSKSDQHVDTETVRAMNLKVYPAGTLLVSCSADLGRCAIVARPLVSNQTFIGLEMDDRVASNGFFYYLMTFKADELNNVSSGTTISYLSREQFEGFAVWSPPDKQEQAAIAAVLADMDAEIAALSARRDKTRDLKQAMMQELLTGKTRLVPAEAAHA